MVALYTVWYNFVKLHKSLKGIAPAMAAGEDVVRMVDEYPERHAPKLSDRIVG